MKRTYIRLLGAFIGFTAILYSPSPAMAQVAPPQLAAGQVLARFSVLGNSAVTGSTDPGTEVMGDVGSSPTPAVTNFPPSRVTPGFGFTVRNLNGLTDPISDQARAAAVAASQFLADQGNGVLRPRQLATQTLFAGIHSFAVDADLAGILTLSGPGNFIFQVPTTLVANVGSSVVLAAGANPCNVFWRVGTSATLNGINFAGNIIAAASITVGVGSNVNGRVIAGTGPTGAVTMAGGPNTIGGCAAPAIVCMPITVNPAALPNGVVGTAYSQAISAMGATGSVTFSVPPGTLPPGLSLNATSTTTAAITGTPTTVGSFNFTITATDMNGCTGTRAYTIVITAVACPVITVNPPPPLPNGVTETAYSQPISSTGGAGPVTYSVPPGTLPNGLSLNATTATTAAITGTPTTVGNFNFTITATDMNGCTGTRAYAIVIAPAAPIPTLDFVGLAILMVLLAGAGLFVINRFSI